MTTTLDMAERKTPDGSQERDERLVQSITAYRATSEAGNPFEGFDEIYLGGTDRGYAAIPCRVDGIPCHRRLGINWSGLH